MDNALSLVVTMSLKDMISDKLNQISSGFQELKKNIPTKDVKSFESAFNGIKVSGVFLALSTSMAKSMVNARMETSKLEANIRSLGVSSNEVDKISLSVRAMSGEYGIAKETFLSGIYDIKSAISSLDPSNLAKVSDSMAKLATATRGDFAGLADVFGTAYSQFNWYLYITIRKN